MNTNTKKMLGGLLSAAVVLSGCNSSYEDEILGEGVLQDEEVYIDPHTSDTTFYEEDVNEYEEEYEADVELDHLQSHYPDLDLEAIETHIEENGLEYNEPELISFLDDLQTNGEITVHENYYADENTFPWWIFLAANVTKTKPTSKITFTKAPATTKKTSSGFGSGSSSSGS